MDNSGKPRQYLAIRTDITQRKAAEATLREQEALAQLGQLAAVVAHEVRNPLAGLRGSLQILESRLPANIRERQIIGPMIQRIDGLSRIVNDILLFANRQPATQRPVELLQAISEAVWSVKATAPESFPPVTVTVPDTIVLADPDMLRSVLLNLLLNACQASRDCAVEVAASVHGHQCHIEVSDRGPGIPPELRERVFDPFFTTKSSGTGLGLPIVKRLVTSMDGSIELRPRAGGGTVAEVVVPVQRQAAPCLQTSLVQ